MRLLQKLCLGLFLGSLASCSHGPHPTVWVSDPFNANALVTDSDSSGSVPVILPYSESAGFSFYDQESEQQLLDYCAARHVSGTAAPSILHCVSTPQQDGVLCESETCVINGTQNGAICKGGGTKVLVTWPDTDRWIALSPPDNTALLAYCNVTLQ